MRPVRLLPNYQKYLSSTRSDVIPNVSVHRPRYRLPDQLVGAHDGASPALPPRSEPYTHSRTIGASAPSADRPDAHERLEMCEEVVHCSSGMTRDWRLLE